MNRVLPGRERGPEAGLRYPGGPLTTLGKSLAVLRITVSARFAYLGELVLRAGFLLLILFIFTQLWRATGRFQNVMALTGYTVAQLIWYLAFTEAIATSGPWARDIEVDREVRSGDLAYRLARPLPYPLFHLGAQIGERLLRFGLNLLIASLIALAVAGPVPLVPAAVAASLLAVVLAFLVDWVWTFSISLLSFWIEDTFGIHLLYRRCLLLLGGTLIPLTAYPEWLRDLAARLPFQLLVYRPARLFVQGDLASLPATLAALTLLLAAGAVPLLLLSHFGLRRVAAQGG